MINYSIILAAGRGVRLLPFSNIFPKGMVPYKDTTIISEGITKLKKSIKEIYVTVGYKKNQLAEHVLQNEVSGVINTTDHGNSWWIFNTIFKSLNEPVLVLTCDNITTISLKNLYNDYIQLNEPACMLVSVKPILGLEGDYIFRKDNFVTKLSRKKKSDIYCSGIQIINPSKINKLTKPQENFDQVWKNLIKKNQLMVSNILPKKWFSIDEISMLKYVDEY